MSIADRAARTTWVGPLASGEGSAAAASSSGLVLPPGCSVREAQVNCSPSRAPLLPCDSVPARILIVPALGVTS